MGAEPILGILSVIVTVLVVSLLFDSSPPGPSAHA